MPQSKGNISIHAKNIMPIIKRWLYSDKDIFIREMVSNGCDAIVKQQMVNPGAGDDYRVTVTLDVPKKELRFEDNGIGMTEDEVKKYINQVAFSSAEEFLKNYEGENKGGIIGHFGLGFYSAFMVARKVTIQTLSGSVGAAPVQWESEDGMKFQMSEGSRATRGTEITLEIADDEEEFLQEFKVQDVLKRYCGFMAQPVYLNVVKPEEPAKDGEEPKDAKPKEPVRINDTPALWLKQPKDCTDEEYRDFYKKVFHVFDEPLFYVHLNVDYPFNLKGILYFPKLTNDFGTREGEIKLFSGQVFVANNIKEVIPDFLMLFKRRDRLSRPAPERQPQLSAKRRIRQKTIRLHHPQGGGPADRAVQNRARELPEILGRYPSLRQIRLRARRQVFRYGQGHRPVQDHRGRIPHPPGIPGQK